MKTFETYTRLDGSEDYDIWLDSACRFNAYINLAIVWHQYDTEGRCTKRIGYNSEGDYNLFDYPPITVTEYSGNTAITCHYNARKEPREIETLIKDEQGRVIYKDYYDVKYKGGRKQTTEYLNDREEVTKYFDFNNELQLHYIEDAAIRYRKYDSTDRDFLIEERFYDAHYQLIDANHNLGMGFEFSVMIRRKEQDGTVSIFYYNADEKQVYHANYMLGK